jgi:hypothetical protein
VTTPRLAPASPQGRPTTGGDPLRVGSPLAPLPSGGRPTPRTPNTTPEELNKARPGATPERPGSTWLLTPRIVPAWEAIHDLLTDGQWHPTTDVANLMHDVADLAPRTIDNQLRSASARRWITRRGDRIRMREDFAAALDEARS